MKRGLAIEGGGMRGIFAAGVIDYFIEKDIHFDNVIGVSAGSIHGINLLSKQKGRAYGTATDFLESKEYCSYYSLLTTGDIFGVDFLYHKIPEEYYPVDREAFRNSGTTFQAVVTNCITGKPEYPVIGDPYDDIEWIRASSSLPLVSRMVPVSGGVYMDGGIADSIPVKKVIENGNDRVVAILTQPLGYVKHKSSLLPIIRKKYKKYPNFVKACEDRHNMYNETLKFISHELAEGRLFVIAPLGKLGISRTEKDRNKIYKGYREGYLVAESLEERLRKFLGE